MYGFPDGFNAKRFVGRTLDQIAFSENTVSFFFSEDTFITVESSFTYSSENTLEKAIIPVTESKVMQLIGQLVKSAEGSIDGTLTLVFKDGQTLKCHDDSKFYESYRIQFGSEEIIV